MSSDEIQAMMNIGHLVDECQVALADYQSPANDKVVKAKIDILLQHMSAEDVQLKIGGWRFTNSVTTENAEFEKNAIKALQYLTYVAHQRDEG